MAASYWQRRNAEMKHIQDEAETAAKLEGEIIQRSDVRVDFNYGEPREYEEIDGKIHVVE